MKFDTHGQITAMMCAATVACVAIGSYAAVVICSTGGQAC